MISIFNGIKNPRKIDRCVYELSDLLSVAFRSYLSGLEDYSYISLFSVSRVREFSLFPYTDCNPSEDTFERLFATHSTDFLEHAAIEDAQVELPFEVLSEVALTGVVQR